jgi:hypothetical protein
MKMIMRRNIQAMSKTDNTGYVSQKEVSINDFSYVLLSFSAIFNSGTVSSINLDSDQSKSWTCSSKHCFHSSRAWWV